MFPNRALVLQKEAKEFVILNVDTSKIEFRHKFENMCRIKPPSKIFTIGKKIVFETLQWVPYEWKLIVIDIDNYQSIPLILDLPRFKLDTPFNEIKFTKLEDDDGAAVIRIEKGYEYILVNLSSSQAAAGADTSVATEVMMSKVYIKNGGPFGGSCLVKSPPIYHLFKTMPDECCTADGGAGDNADYRVTDIKYLKCFPSSSCTEEKEEVYLVCKVLSSHIFEDGDDKYIDKQILSLVVVSGMKVIKSTRIKIDPFLEENNGDDFIDKILPITLDNSQFLLFPNSSSERNFATRIKILTNCTVKLEEFNVNYNENFIEKLEEDGQEKFFENFTHPYGYQTFFIIPPTKNDYLLAAQKISDCTNLPIDLSMIIIRF
jgi:hypothetical protein